jgi:hypothetical protein
MTSIYEKLLTLHNNEALDDTSNAFVVSNLIGLLKASCGIDLSEQADPFVYSDFSVMNDGYFELSYNFKYGIAYLSTIPVEHNLKVSFSFSNEIQETLYKNTVCYLDVDYNMTFEKSLLNRVFEFSKTILNQSKLSSDWSVLLVNTTVNSDLTTVNHFSYQNNASYSNSSDDIEDLMNHGLPACYMNYVKEFDELFFTFLKFQSTKPHVFYEVFPEYPSYLDIISSIDYLIKNLEMFSQQYSDDKRFLKSKIALIEMRLI